jgi:hypothetical protein
MGNVGAIQEVTRDTWEWTTVEQLAQDIRYACRTLRPMTAERGAHFLRVIGRLGPDSTLEAAQAELDVIAAALAGEYPDDSGGRGIRVASELETLDSPTCCWPALPAEAVKSRCARRSALPGGGSSVSC